MRNQAELGGTVATWAAPTVVSPRVSPVLSAQIKHTTGGVCRAGKEFQGLIFFLTGGGGGGGEGERTKEGGKKRVGGRGRELDRSRLVADMIPAS